MPRTAILGIAALLLSSLAQADEVVLRSNLAYTGVVKSIDGNVLVLQRPGAAEKKFALSEIYYVEYTDRDTETGGPSSLGARKLDPSQTSPKSGTTSDLGTSKDVVILKDSGVIVQCELANVTHNQVTCATKPASTYGRDQVWRVYFHKR